MNKVIIVLVILIGLYSSAFADYNEDIAYVDGSHQGKFISNMAGNMRLDKETKYEYCETRWNKASNGKVKYAKVRYYGNRLQIIWIKACMSHI